MKEKDYDVKKKKLIEDLSWVALLLSVGILFLLPKDLPNGVWALTIGIILVAMNVAKAVFQIPMSTLTSASGAILIVAGLAEYLGLDIPTIPIILIVIALTIGVRSYYGYTKK